jgi:hypothetical protein
MLYGAFLLFTSPPGLVRAAGGEPSSTPREGLERFSYPMFRSDMENPPPGLFASTPQRRRWGGGFGKAPARLH